MVLQLEDQDSGELDSLVHSTQHGTALLKLLQPASQAEKQVALADAQACGDLHFSPVVRQAEIFPAASDTARHAL